MGRDALNKVEELLKEPDSLGVWRLRDGSLITVGDLKKVLDKARQT